MSYPEFRRLESSLSNSGDLGDPSEIHGALCAMFAVARIGEEAWLAQVLGQGFAPGDVLGREAERLLHELYAGTVAQLQDVDMVFYPLLPDDDEDITLRTRSLASWCSGFLYGLGVSGVSEVHFGDEETAELIDDLGKIAQVSADVGGGDGSDEQSYAELVEYVRMGTIMLTTHFQGPAPDSALH